MKSDPMAKRDKSSVSGFHNSVVDLLGCRLTWLFVGAVLSMAFFAIVAWEIDEGEIDPNAQGSAWPILQSDKLYAVIEDVQGDRLQMKMVHSAISRDGRTILQVGSVLNGIRLWQKEMTRNEVCVEDIIASDARKIAIGYVGPTLPRKGCLAAVHAYDGTAGLPLGTIHPGTAVRIYLNGDLFVTR